MRWRNRAWSSTMRILSGMGGVLASKPYCVGEGASLAHSDGVNSGLQLGIGVIARSSWQSPVVLAAARRSRLVHETGDGFLQVPRTFRASQLHRVSGVGDAHRDRERNPP